MKHPKLLALPINANSCRVWCPYCARWHFHGCDDVERRRWTHRVAHCGDSSSPFHESGYLIKLASKAVRAEIAKAMSPARVAPSRRTTATSERNDRWKN